MEKRNRVTKEGEHVGDDYTHTILFTLGTAFLVAAFVKRAVMLFLVEQWRVWVFLILNIVLLAIFFTSTPETRDFEGDPKAKKIKSKQCEFGLPEKAEEEDEFERYMECRGVEVDEAKQISKETLPVEVQMLSNEELNKRVEAFIVMFKQHLVLDAKKGGNRLFLDQTERQGLKFQKYPK